MLTGGDVLSLIQHPGLDQVHVGFPYVIGSYFLHLFILHRVVDVPRLDFPGRSYNRGFVIYDNGSKTLFLASQTHCFDFFQAMLSEYSCIEACWRQNLIMA